MKYRFPLLLSFSLLTITAWSQVRFAPVMNPEPGVATRTSGNLPVNYYNTASGLNCSALKTALYNIISSGTTTLAYSDVWATQPRTDKRRNDANTQDIVWDMYSDNPTGPEPYEYRFVINQCGNYDEEGDCFNREHTFPQSWFNDQLPMRSDINHVFPTDGEVNGIRSNFPFGEVTTASKTTRNGSKLGLGNNFGYTGTVFEPIHEYKGDIARAILYMAVRYQNEIAGWQSNGNANDVLNGTSYQVFDAWHLKLLYKWHTQDPVSQKEINRNDSVFVIQGNRNPFIDHPEWVYAIWSCTGQITATSVNDLLTLPEGAVRVYPNPVQRQPWVTVELSKPFTETITLQVIDITGRVMVQQLVTRGQLRIPVPTTSLQPGIYTIKLNTSEGFVVRKLLVQQ